MSLSLLVTINGLVCLAGTVIGILFAGASIISIANLKVAWVGWLLIAAFLVPVMFVVSGVGVWLTSGHAVLPVVVGLVALPWLYGSAFVVLMLRAFES